MSNIHKKILASVTTGTSEVIDTRGYWPITMAVRFEASTSAGVVTFETSPDPAFSGTWKSIGTVTWTAANQILTVSAAQDAYRYVRARITTNIVGGNASVWITGAGYGFEGWTESP